MTSELSQDALWLLSLDKEVRTVHKGTDWRNPSYETFIDERILTEDEMKRIFNIVADNDNYLFEPANVGFGFRVGYCVSLVQQEAPGIQPEFTGLFCVSEKQLPDGWGWDDLQPHFTSPKKRKYLGLEPVQQKGHYEY